MKRALFLTFIILIPLFGAPAAKKLRVGVLDFTAKGISETDAAVASELFRSELVASGVFDVLDRNNMNDVLKEQSFQQSGCTENACAVQVGKMLNMQYMIYGSLMKAGAAMFIIAQMISVESTQIERSARIRVESIDTLEQAVKQAVQELSGLKQKKEASSYATKGMGILSINSEPSGATVIIDGVAAGQTKLFKEIGKGTHKIKVSKDGFISKEFEETIDEGQTREINLVLSKGIGLEEAMRRREDAVFGMLWKGGACAGTLGLMTAGIVLGNMNYDSAEGKLVSYNNEIISAKALTAGDEIASLYGTADMWYLIGESGLVLSAAFAVWAVFDVIDYFSYNDMVQSLKKNTMLRVTPTSLSFSVRF